MRPMPDPFEPSETPRPITAEELGLVVKVCRLARSWSQENLAAEAGVTVRTVQRVEAGKSCDLQTKRALARAFGAEDIDVFNRPAEFPSLERIAEERRQEEEKRRRDFLELPVRAADGRTLIDLLARAGCLSFGAASGFEPSKDARRSLAEAQDFMRDCLDIAGDIGATGWLDLAEDLDSLIKRLGASGVALRAAERDTALRFGDKPMKLTVAYVVACGKGREPETVWVPNKADPAF